MKKGILIIIAVLSFSFGFAQTEKGNYKTIISEFQSNYNDGDYEAIYNMLNANFQKTLTLEKTKSFFQSDLNAEALGEIEAVEFKNVIRTGHTYKLVFENAEGEAFFLLDNDNKISGFQISPQKQ